MGNWYCTTTTSARVRLDCCFIAAARIRSRAAKADPTLAWSCENLADGYLETRWGENGGEVGRREKKWGEGGRRGERGEERGRREEVVVLLKYFNTSQLEL